MTGTTTGTGTGTGTAPQEDVVDVLLAQHQRIRDLFADVRAAQGEHKQQAFDELRALLAVHETGEELVVRPAAERAAGKGEAKARNEEEAEANRALLELEKLDVASPEFDAELTAFQQAVEAHAQHEETEEFPALRASCDAGQRRAMGRRLLAAERIAPTHPHPGTAGKPALQWTVGPFASLLDQAKDAFAHHRD
ncbi:hemerythrin domain-containing protein [Kitasatospora sp. NRRL B-11411]|uniref:hemerythrin domain-containing protein n=1 Tax=Kitasatospora sp. NRRL B-11411 TaxID=1463822 RepID=UPI000565D510|nr:hemerythrin domain-containing protein [Kitasatospora sp. NRRL B-11411]